MPVVTEPTIKTQETQLDWLTMTTSNKDLGVKWLARYAALRLHHPKMRGCEERHFQWQGYWCRSVPGVLLFGARDNGEYIFQAVSGMADDCFPITYGADTRVTRVDLAVTITLERPLPDLAQGYYEYALENGNQQRSYTYYQNSRGGSTLYVGARSSEQFGRVYDKGKQLQIKHHGDEIQPGYIWRYEVCLKKPKASPLCAELLRQMPSEGFGAGTRQLMSRFVYMWFFDRMIRPLFTSEDVELPKIGIEYHESSAERKLKWIKTQVRPSMVFLLEQGFQEELQEALGYSLTPHKPAIEELPF